jgi:DNA-binding NarL/FixJ family response regulator
LDLVLQSFQIQLVERFRLIGRTLTRHVQLGSVPSLTHAMIKIGILEDDLALRTTIAEYLRLTCKFDVVFEASGFSEMPALTGPAAPQLVLMDVHLKDGVSLDRIQQMLREMPALNLVIITGDENDDMLLKAIENGARGYVLKPFSMSELVTTLEHIHSGGPYLSGPLVKRLMRTLNRRKYEYDFERNKGLTDREAAVASLLRDGYSYKEIAGILNISYHTVNQHVKKIYDKLGINSKTELIHYQG